MPFHPRYSLIFSETSLARLVESLKYQAAKDHRLDQEHFQFYGQPVLLVFWNLYERGLSVDEQVYRCW